MFPYSCSFYSVHHARYAGERFYDSTANTYYEARRNLWWPMNVVWTSGGGGKYSLRHLVEDKGEEAKHGLKCE